MIDNPTNENVLDTSVKDPPGAKDRYDDPQFEQELEDVADDGGRGPVTEISDSDETIGHGNAEGAVNVMDDSVPKED